MNDELQGKSKKAKGKSKSMKRFKRLAGCALTSLRVKDRQLPNAITRKRLNALTDRF